MLLEAFRAGVAAAQPADAVRGALPPRPRGRAVVVACGKAAGAMVGGLEGWGAFTGVGVTTPGQNLPQMPGFTWLEGSHPLPDAKSATAGRAILEITAGLEPDDLLLCLISGGASALVCAPRGLELSEKIRVTDALLRSGADIASINTVRKHLSDIKGGRLAERAYPAQVEALIVSDVVGDDTSTIGSGPTAPDATTRLEAIRILEHHSIPVPDALRLERAETPKPGDPIFERVRNRVIVGNRMSLDAMRAVLEQRGYAVKHSDDAVTGDARVAATAHARLARGLPRGAALLSGGETTVQVRGDGRGGRNLEFALQLVIENAGLYALAADSDGKDGSSDAAGAIVTPDSLERARALGMDPLEYQARNDAHGLFDALGDLVRTGPTGTNVNDLRVVMRGA